MYVHICIDGYVCVYVSLMHVYVCVYMYAYVCIGMVRIVLYICMYECTCMCVIFTQIPHKHGPIKPLFAQNVYTHCQQSCFIMIVTITMHFFVHAQ